MSYEHKSNVNPKKVSLPLKVVGVIIVILALSYIFMPTLISTFFSNLIRPLWIFQRKVSEGTVTTPVELQNATILELQKENADLRRLIDNRTSSSSLVAYVLKKPPFTAYDTFIIDAGSLVGVKNAAKVYAIGNVLIGEITEVSPLTSKVKLYSSYGEKYEVFIGNIQTTALGRGGGAFEASVPRDVSVQEGSTVTIPHLTTSVFGIVRKVIADPARAFSTILFSQPINIYEQKWVEIDK